MNFLVNINICSYLNTFWEFRENKKSVNCKRFELINSFLLLYMKRYVENRSTRLITLKIKIWQASVHLLGKKSVRKSKEATSTIVPSLIYETLHWKSIHAINYFKNKNLASISLEKNLWESRKGQRLFEDNWRRWKEAIERGGQDARMLFKV